MYFSVRMRASLKGEHISGQERIVEQKELEKILIELYRRPKEEWDFINIKIEKLSSPPEVIDKALPVKSYSFPDVNSSWSFVINLLKTYHGIRKSLTAQLLDKLVGGLHPKGGNLRGAVIIDPSTGKILNKNPEKGIRTILFDWKRRENIQEVLLKKGYTERTVDALALATKNIYCGIEIELCISDDPSYITGYIASKKLGYIRITPLKKDKTPFGGRVYFISESMYPKIIKCLREKAVLIENISNLE
ncbi:MAG TPA: 6-carboxyhexanoate--CoA ligase [Aquificales bacterium]|uniref:6-carboxyhexanoate--CoA ligase n=1 Tax=Aquifex aeolicus TaxID=63363 RepID=A0A9D0YPK9_AQUAO|nr:6-carboxyhexanoate--CoA ligase [Aquificales bacterium]HIP98730.1 6-carboxyhexanoate--CoA ligase [Aquifex aeolicus]